jgi:hypothetical protein
LVDRAIVRNGIDWEDRSLTYPAGWGGLAHVLVVCQQRLQPNGRPPKFTQKLIDKLEYAFALGVGRPGWVEPRNAGLRATGDRHVGWTGAMVVWWITTG